MIAKSIQRSELTMSCLLFRRANPDWLPDARLHQSSLARQQSLTSMGNIHV
jgi:hypothetical protein